ncbi:MAG TPA: SulP family inorganic anion transporter [Rhodoglobus sp.]|nr:SulP family inorganic anion transporter [Rhodoglobus sp.]HOY81791.1 SulP family inorganic anion transporter [Rhodoglobus sp.]HPZ34259.1 SulP family inorganic anion transporter [Microbacteriaceae bacterium]HQI66501.1 SulP family inorganic anion transporter [Rhodoglobus sp.]HQJ35147.1 SulP family inorganic anion transporter [Rhodoglobus sp.]
MNPAKYLASLLPTWRDYRSLKRTWRGDLLAGVTVGIVALPLALAFGVSSGAGAEAGLVTAIVAGLVAAVFGGSNIQVSGPTGAMVVVLGPIVVTHGPGVVAMVSVMAGVVVLIGGLLKLGRVVSFIPWPVIEGFTLGIAVIIFLQQVPAAIGAKAGASTNALVAAVESFATVNPATLWWALGSVVVVAAIMVVAPRIHRQLPGSLIAIALVTVVATLASLPLARIGALPSSLPAPGLPALDPAVVGSLVGPALTVAALAAIESLLSARVGASLADTGAYEPDRELVGQGLASLASGLFGGMPATGAIARTAVNVRSGGRTRVAAITHSLVLLAVVSLAATVVSGIPLAALSGVLMVTAVRMVSIPTVRAVVRSTRSDAIVFFITAIVTVSFDLIIAVGIGIAVAAFFALRALARSGGVHREELPGAAQPGDERIALFRLDGALFFGAADRMLDRVNEISNVTVVIIRMSQLQVLDATGARVITEMIHALERRGITVLVKGIQPEHLELATRVGVIASLRDERHLFTELEPAIEHARSHVARAGLGSL